MGLKFTTSKLISDNVINITILLKRNNVDMPAITGIQKDDSATIKVLGYIFACQSESLCFVYLQGHFRLQKRQTPPKQGFDD
ncbi:uncharacterized protein KPYH43_c1785 [Klebsiella pneumoniae]|nr:uncharacterized protein KPYH43_c1785 [Klebsiella pneumoniae]